ncbi:hypothetical protein BUALT_Bualt02G0091000 [Buddleja alternifolia]|uniref:Transferase n=1 Tax=Buddleja alternifolia TaxID=168488 RepID=A0AAV6Y022_9LAMI|nr:hypothetical protein BUALT_Bualt02G0091000 [Buddleja alternifolia]
MAISKLHIEAVQTVIPTKPTDPISSCRLQLPLNLMSSSTVLQRRFHMVLCYNKASEEDSGWVVAGWIKESLGRALKDQPIIAGRLRRSSDEDYFEIVSNDSGVRMVESRVEMKLIDFLGLKAKKEDEAELVFWQDVVEQNPQFSPLFYVQITNFSCGGYSIGISCSLLLVDPFVLTSFLKSWINVHKTIVSKPNLPKIPIFYVPKFGKPISSQVMGSNTGKNAAESVVFTISTENSNSDNNVHKNLVAACIDEAEHEIGTKMASKFSLFLKVPSEDAKVEICSREGLLENSSTKINGLTCGRMRDELELDNICFNEGNKPAYVSSWINSFLDDEGSVMIIPANDRNSGMKVIVTFT